MFFIGDDFKCLQQPKKSVYKRFYILTNNPILFIYLFFKFFWVSYVLIV